MKGLNNPIGIKSLEPRQSPFIMNPSRFTSPSNTFTDTFDNDDGWTLGSGYSIGSNKISWSNTSTVTSNKALGFTLSDTLWYMDYELTPTADNDVDMFKQFTLGLSNSTSMMAAGSNDWCTDGVAMKWADYHPETRGNDGGTTDWNSEGSNLPYGTKYYNRMERSSSTILNVDWHSDSDRTTSVGGTGSGGWGNMAINSTNIGHAYLSLGGGTGGGFTGSASNVYVYDAVAP